MEDPTSGVHFLQGSSSSIHLQLACVQSDSCPWISSKQQPESHSVPYNMVLYCAEPAPISQPHQLYLHVLHYYKRWIHDQLPPGTRLPLIHILCYYSHSGRLQTHAALPS